MSKTGAGKALELLHSSGLLPRKRRVLLPASNHIVALPSAGDGLISPLGKKKLGVGNPAVALIAGDKSAAVGLVWVFYVIENVADGGAGVPALALVQRNNARGCQMDLPLFYEKKMERRLSGAPIDFMILLCSA